MPKGGPTIASEATRIIGDRAGVVPHDILVAELVARGRTRAVDPSRAIEAALGQKTEFVRLPDGSWTHIGVLLEGRSLVHRLTREEVDRGWLEADPDFSPLATVVRRHARSGPRLVDIWSWYEDESAIDPERPWRRWLVGFGGLRGVGEADLIEATLAEGRVTIAALRPEADVEPERRTGLLVAWLASFADDLRSLADDTYAPGVPAHRVLAIALAGMPPEERPRRLWLSELFEQAGFVPHGEHVGSPEADWSAWENDQRRFLAGFLDRLEATDWLDEEPGGDFDEDLDEAVLADFPGTDRAREPSTYRLRIELKEMRPPVWRVVEVPGDITLGRLHRVVRTAMGWLGGHLHEFRIDDIAYGPRTKTGIPEPSTSGVPGSEASLVQAGSSSTSTTSATAGPTGSTWSTSPRDSRTGRGRAAPMDRAHARRRTAEAHGATAS
jgi:hypothetical protein